MSIKILLIPNVLATAGSLLEEIDLKNFIRGADDFSGLSFALYLKGGSPLPKGLHFSSEGILSGVPGQDCIGSYNLVFEVKDNVGGEFYSNFKLLIQPSLSVDSREVANFQEVLTNLMGSSAVSSLGIKTAAEIYNWETTPLQAYYLAGRFGYLAIWNAHDSSDPGLPTKLTLPGASKHYNVYDRGSCIVAAPCDLYDYARTAHDSFVTARAIASEVYKRRWSVEFSGFDKMVGAAWVRLQQLASEKGHPIEIVNYIPRKQDKKLCIAQNIKISKTQSTSST